MQDRALVFIRENRSSPRVIEDPDKLSYKQNPAYDVPMVPPRCKSGRDSTSYLPKYLCEGLTFSLVLLKMYLLMSHNSKFARIDGIVVEALPGLVFKVNILVKNEEGKEEEKEVLGHLAGKLKINHIRIIPGDRVSLEMPDLNDRRGRIVRRL